MARDRQRAKQRRRRQPGGGGPTGPSRTRPREPDVEREPEVEREAEDTSSTVFPQRGDVRPVEGPDDFGLDEDEAVVEPAPDELDPAVTEEREEERERTRPGRRRSRGRIFTFLGHVVDELRRVQWPDRRHVGQGTAVVLGFVVIAGTYLGLLDAIWKPLIDKLL
jgi:preprotein translocase subunit SecE